jgi:hypothetical protein
MVPAILRIILISLVFRVLSGFFLHPWVHAEDRAIRHEVTGGIRWISDEYTYDDYVVNGEAFPAIVGSFDQKFLILTSSYTFFFTPVIEEQDGPIALQRFYSHPGLFSVNFSYQPEKGTTYTYQDRASHYRSYRYRDERARSAGLNFEYYLWRNTGLSFQFSSIKNKQDVRTLNTLNDRGTGENNEIRRYYGVGVSHYFLKHSNIRLSYTGFDFDYLGTERTWTASKSSLFTAYFGDTATTGRKVTLMGEYIFRKILGIQGFHEIWDQKAHSKMTSSYYGVSSGLISYYDDDATNYSFGTTLSVYIGKKTTFRVGGSYTLQKLERTYNTTDQVVEYDWNITTVEVGIFRYLNRYIGMQIGYEFARRDGDVLTWHPESETDLRTAYTAKAEFHALYVGLTGRF